MCYLAVLLLILVLSRYPPFPGSEYDEEEVDYEESDSDESWTTESAISSEAILSSMCMNGGDEKPFACPVPGCKKRYKVSGSANLLFFPDGAVGRSSKVSVYLPCLIDFSHLFLWYLSRVHILFTGFLSSTGKLSVLQRMRRFASLHVKRDDI